MRLWRNRELRTELLVMGGATLLLGTIGFFVHPAAGAFALGAGLIALAVRIVSARRQYRRIAALADALDRILNGETQTQIESSDEGELSILTAELCKLIARLNEQSAALAADKRHLSEAIADILHQIRTPLTSIRLGLTMLAKPELSRSESLALLHELMQQTERIGRLAEMLLKLSKLDAGTANLRPAAVPVRALLDRAAEPFRIPMELRGQTLSICAGDETVFCDPDWTTEALANLLKNAMEHTPAGGTVTVASIDTPLYAELSVQDSGEGIAPEDLGRVFERYYKGKNATAESIGIGLAFAREILAAQNGTITAANAPTGGARFTVRLYRTTI